MDNLEYLQKQLQISEGGGIYFEQGRVDAQKDRAFLFVGLGGTGSGTFLDMAYIIRQIAEERHYQKPQLLGYLALADLYPYGNQHVLKTNCFAALKELDYWMSVGEHQDSFR